jgi:hypothetical protein
MPIITEYMTMLLKIIKLIPVECKYYFIDITDYNRCFVAIRKVFVRLRKDYNDIEEKVRPILDKKYEKIKPNLKKKKFRPEARSIFYFLDRKVPMDLVMYKVIELNEIMRNEHAKKDPILQTKNTDMLSFTSGMRHQCTLVRNLMFSYLYNISKIKIIYVSFKTFFNEFGEFDKNHKEEYQKAKDDIGDEDFYENQGIHVVEYMDNEKKEKSKTSSELSLEMKNKAKRKKETDSEGNTMDGSELEEEEVIELKEPSESSGNGEEEEEQEQSGEDTNEFVLPENQGTECLSLNRKRKETKE